MNRIHQLTNFDAKAKPSVLVADDDPITRKLLSRFLEDIGHEVFVAEDGEQAWTIFSARRPKLVITDCRMPKLDGIGLCKRIRGSEVNDYTFLLMLTSTSEKAILGECFAAGADDFMKKPFKRDELQWRLHSGLRILDLHSNLESRITQLDDARSRLESANEEMSAGLQAASNTQRSLLPKEPPAVKGIQCDWMYSPSDHLGGDSLNMFQLDENRLGFFLADVCGHGLPSALLAVTLHRLLTPVLGHSGLLNDQETLSAEEFFGDPGRVLSTVNKRFPMKIEEGEYFTAVYGVIDTLNSTLSFAGAGHPHPIVLSNDGKVSRLSTSGFPVGFDEDIQYETQVHYLRPGDQICLFTDGILEAANQEKEMFGDDRMIELLKQVKREQTPEPVEAIVSHIQDWAKTTKQQDDISIMLLKFDGRPSRCNTISSGCESITSTE